ncbi:SusC/RagA family TonB-linked outer membrane protein [Ilyomonas limi]|uniref:SusC/RagA family TonB-linked outer membrane protein n=1 Tax=Ilyomonas limi TaxID=2575867 RepID=A0A4U3L8Y2_9BACT|nr:SusC/RagA family TonB-linked outer membrane protein [Ilyomonas limi]TKK71738.1 SusC/RagA family TonB-linked outer membrane protein [Ilyomonas limi]
MKKDNCTKPIWRHVLLAVLSIIALQAGAQEQRSNVTGIVKNEQGAPLTNATVTVNNKNANFTASTQTDTGGVFHFSGLPAGDAYNFTFLYIGYESQTLTGYTLKPGATLSLIVNLKGQSNALNDVVVVGYGTQRKANLTGAVAQVSGDVLENRSLPNITQGLQGLIPNLNLVMGDGKPTQSPTYNIRGTTSIGQGGNALVLIDGVQGDPSLLNPADIASVTVLKDAASAAIYGARAAFGVVLITTKNPSKDRATFTYSSNYSIKSPTAVPDIVSNGYQYASMFNEAWSAWNDYSQVPQNINKTQPFSQAYLEEFKRRNENPSLPRVDIDANGNYVYYGNTDWYDLLYKNHNSATDQNISVSGSSGKASYYITGRYFGQSGLFRYNSDDYKMYNFTAKGSVQLLPWLQITNTTQYTNRLYHNPLNVGEGGGIWRNLADEGHPSSVLFNPDGTFTQSAAYTVGDFVYGKNGIDFSDNFFKNTVGASARLFSDKVHIRGDFTYQQTNNNQKRIRVPVPYSVTPGVIAYVGTATNDLQMTADKNEYMATNIYADYESRFGGGHYFKALVGYNYEQSVANDFATLRNGLIYPNATDLNLALGQNISTSGGYEKWAIMGGFYRLNYSYKDRYLIEADGRYDGSSKFPSNQRFAFFPSVSAGWRVAKESFWHVSPSFISDLKIRASYGSLGNGNINSYVFLENFAISQSGRVINGVRPQQTSQPNVLPDGLTWETSTTKDLGLDMNFLNNRLAFTGDVYIRKTTDMFTVGQTLPAVFGTDIPKGNYADLKTNGWEASLTWQDAFEISNKPFRYNIGVWMSDYTATVTKYNNTGNKLTDYYAGKTIGEIWGYTNDGYWTADNVADAAGMQAIFKASTSGQWLPGDIKFKDLNGDKVINNGSNTLDDHGDLSVIGNTTPRYSYGISLGADYANFSFSAFFQGVGKQDWWPGGESDVFWGQYNRPYNYLFKSQVGNIWSEENPNAYWPRYRGYVAQNSQGELHFEQTKYLQNAAYIRLKNIQLGYTLPATLVNHWKLTAVRLYVSGENLWSWSPLYKVTKNIDVENIGKSDVILTGTSNNGNGNNYPILKSVTFGLSVTL